MKRLFLICLVMLLCSTLLPCCMGEDAPAYEAIAALDFHLRSAPESEYRVIAVPENEAVKVYEYGDDWCRVGYKNEIGWAKTKWLWAFRSLDAARYPVPGAPEMAGVVTLDNAAWIVGGDFKGLTALPGTRICVSSTSDDGYALPVWRGQGSIGKESGTFTGFAPFDDAHPGDIIAGFTTFYNERTGGSLAAERAYNIALGCQKIDGTVIAPNSEFSFNALCAPYKHSNGYRKAPNISNDGVGYGGGVCQVTTTLYNALLGLPLQITDWAVHRRSGVQYIPQYFDAAVGTYSDLKFVNTLPYPIRIWAQPQNGAVTVLILRDTQSP